MRWNTRAPREAGNADVHVGGDVASASSVIARDRSRGPWRRAVGERRGRSSGSGGRGARARRGRAGAFPATLARGLPLTRLEAGSYLLPPTELQPRTFRGFRRFDFAFRLPFFRAFGPGVRYKGVGVYSRLMPAPRAHASACTMVRLRSHDICRFAPASRVVSRLVALSGLHRRARPRRGARAHIPREPRLRERRHERRHERRPRPRRAQRVGPSAPQLMLGGGPSWVTSASFHRVAMMDARPCGAGPTGRLAGSTSSLRRARLFSCPLAPRPL